jgi:predicted dehydrogenase
MLRDGGIGAVEEVHADFFIGAHFGGFRDEMAFPLILDMSIHTFDASRFLSGADPVSVTCHAWNPKRSWYKGDASAVAVFEFTKGIVFSYRGSWCAEGLHTPWNSHWRIVGSKGCATWDGAETLKAQSVKKGGKHGFFSEMEDVPVPPLAMEHTGHGALMREFVTAVRTGKKPETASEDNIKSLAMVMAAVESAKTGKRVKVKW